jgi:acetyl esterase/lipase
VDEKDKTKIASDLTITKETPQAFIAMTADDPVKVENGLVYASELQKVKVPFELHIYPSGGHGYGLRKTKDPVTTWDERLSEWFTARGLTRSKSE